MDFKNQYTHEAREAEALRMRTKYPERIPTICQKSAFANRSCPTIDKSKYLVPTDLTMGQFVWVIRKRLKISSDQAIYMFINGTIPPVSKLMSTLYNELHDQDGFLYIYYNFENTFGGDNIETSSTYH